MATAGATAAATIQASSYRVKFRREEFLRLVEIANPRIIYHRRRRHFFAFDGFVMYTCDCEVVDFNPPLDEALSVNAYGARHLVDLARALNDAPVMHTSTCFVVGSRSGGRSASSEWTGMPKYCSQIFHSCVA